MSPQDLDDPAAVVERREDGVRSVEQTQRTSGRDQSVNRSSVLKPLHRKHRDMSLYHTSSGTTQPVMGFELI